MKRINKSLSATRCFDKLIHQIFSAQIDMENQLDHIKSQLLSNSKFNIVDLFQTLDYRRLRAISAGDLDTFFKNVGLAVSLQEIEMVLKYFTDKQFIDFNGFFLRLLPLSGRPISNEASSLEQLISKLFLTIIQHSETVLKAKMNLTTIETRDMENICQDASNFTIQDLSRLFKKFGGWNISHQNGKVIFGSKLRLNRQDLCSKLCLQYKQLTVNQSYNKKQTQQTNDESTLKLRSQRQCFSSSFFEDQVKFFVDMQISQHQRQMLYE